MQTKFKLTMFLAWDYDREEAFLDKMSEKGWQLKKGGLLHHTYEKSTRCYRYKLDYNPRSRQSYEENTRYIQLFEEQGWEYINTTINGWSYFRKEYVPGTADEEYEIYTDEESLKEMLNRWNRIMRFFQVYYLLFTLLNLAHFSRTHNYYNGSCILLGVLVSILLLTGKRAISKKSVHKNSKSSRGVYGGYILFGGVILSFILMLFYLFIGHYNYRIEFTRNINCNTPDFTKTITVDEDGSYYLDAKCNTKRGVIMLQIKRGDSIVYNGGGADFKIQDKHLSLKKGTYDINVIYYLEDYQEKFNASTENLEELHLTGDLEEYSRIKVFIGIRK